MDRTLDLWAARPRGRRCLTRGVARRVRLLALDVDGVLTDNGIYIGAVGGGERVELKRFDIQDGLGLALLRRDRHPRWPSSAAGVSEATALRARELRIDDVLQDSAARKVPLLAAPARASAASAGTRWPSWATTSPTSRCMQRVGLPIAVANAVPEVKAIAAYVTERVGRAGRRPRGGRPPCSARGTNATRPSTRYLAARDGHDA